MTNREPLEDIATDRPKKSSTDSPSIVESSVMVEFDKSTLKRHNAKFKDFQAYWWDNSSKILLQINTRYNAFPGSVMESSKLDHN